MNNNLLLTILDSIEEIEINSKSDNKYLLEYNGELDIPVYDFDLFISVDVIAQQAINHEKSDLYHPEIFEELDIDVHVCANEDSVYGYKLSEEQMAILELAIKDKIKFK